MDKKAAVCIHNGVLLSHKKNTSESVLMRWMKLEPIIDIEVSQKEKHQYSILMSMVLIRISLLLNKKGEMIQSMF